MLDEFTIACRILFVNQQNLLLFSLYGVIYGILLHQAGDLLFQPADAAAGRHDVK